MPSPDLDPDREFLIGGGAMSERVRGFDWSATPLGPRAAWPASLRTTVSNLLACGQPIALWVGPDLTTLFNDGFGPILGARAATALGQPLREVWFDVWDDIRPLVDRAMAGETVWMENMPLTMLRNGYEEETWWTFSYSPVRDETGRVVGFLDTVTETTRAVLAERALSRLNEDLAAEVENVRTALAGQRVLQRELAHRMKNTLAMVQAIVSQSLRHAPSADDAAQLASERIQALGRAQDALTASDWRAADIHEVFATAIAPHRDGDDRFSVQGGTVKLSAEQAMGLTLAVHELATNAVKYGALSVPGGRVSVVWNKTESGAFSLCWQETGGPVVGPRTRKGFGTRLTERVVPGYFGGTARTDYRPDGVIFLLEGSLAERG